MNDQIFFKLYSLAHINYFLDRIIVFCADYLPYILILLVGIFILYKSYKVINQKNLFSVIRNSTRDLIFIFAPAVLGWVIADILKNIFASPRPFIEFKDQVTPLFTHGGMDSFPSGHATFYIILAFGIFSINKKLGYLMFFFALVIGLARIISGIHFPIDILSGYILGIIIFLIFNQIFAKKIK